MSMSTPELEASSSPSRADFNNDGSSSTVEILRGHVIFVMNFPIV